ncbi:MAG: M23 family metallopeptidase [Stagnimonas sp.]|nr:M23 family metallopeptidase [Stagnimonas sp.]
MHLKSWLSAVLALCCAAAVAQDPPPLQLKGSFEQGALIFGSTAPGVAVSVDGRVLRTTAQGRFVFGLDRDAATEVTLVLTSPGGVPSTLRYPVAKRSYAIQRLNGLPPKLVNPDPKMDERIARESASNRAARARDTAVDYVFQQFVWPAKGPITGVFGSQRIMNGDPKQPHYGVDVAGPVGAPVIAPADGIVSLANPDMFFSGGTLYLDHGHGVSSAFLHLSRILVKPGQTVKQGEKIALIGKTGRVTGAHLDWRVNWFESRVDAAQLVPAIQSGRTP